MSFLQADHKPLGVAALACLLPASRAARVDPAVAPRGVGPVLTVRQATLLARDEAGALQDRIRSRGDRPSRGLQPTGDVLDEPERIVVVKAVGIKAREKVLVGGREIKL